MLNLIIRIVAWCWFRVRIPWSRFWRFLEWQGKAVPKIRNFGNLNSILPVMKWTADPRWKLGDVLQTPEWTWAHKKDDCDGFALVALAAMAQSKIRWGYLLTVITRPIKESHSVALFPWDAIVHPESGIVITPATEWKWTSNAQLKKCHAASFSDLIRQVFLDRKILLVDVRDLNLKNKKREFKRMFKEF